MTDILHADKRVLVAVKPAGVLSTDEAGGMPALLRQTLGDDKACVKTVHRLDAAVGGVMVFARSARAASILSEEIRNGGFEKEYLAVCHGVLDEKSGLMRDLLGHDGARRMTYVAECAGKGVQEAELFYEVLGEAEGLSLVRVELHTGRTHQIRVQFASRGHGLVGDRKYGKMLDRCPIALWSHAVGFTHPESGERLRVCAEPPAVYPWTEFTM